MCTKHEHCCSSKVKVHQPASSCCSAPKITSIKAVGVEGNSDCCSSDSGSGGSCCSSESSDEDGDPARPSENDTLLTQSWKIAGMDCPSCARKVENAVINIEGVDKVNILFATEKLVVKFNHHSLVHSIETAVTNAGFTLHSDLVAKDSSKNRKDIRSFMAENVQLLSLAAAMGVASAINLVLPHSIVSPKISEWLFLIVCLAGLIPIARQAYKLARAGSPFSIETLMSVAALGALYLGETTEAAMVLLLFLIGEKLEAFASSKARSGVHSLMALVPERAIKIVDGKRTEVAAGELQPGDLIEISAGARLAADGILLSGASFDESALTGESLPVERVAGEQVMAGSVVVDKVVQLTITSKQGENAIDRILHLIEEAESHKAPIERFLDKFSRVYTPLMMLLSLLVILTPPLLFSQPWETWIYRGLALLLIACPCALVISTPAAITSGLAAAAKHGALIKGGAALELLGKVEAIAFDKTGTLTKGKPEVVDLIPLNGLDSSQLLSLSASIEEGSSHPLAVSLVKKAHQESCKLFVATEKTALAGSGVSGVIDGRHYALIAPDKTDNALSSKVIEAINQLENQGKTVAVLLRENELQGLISWQDTLRDEAKEAVTELNKMGLRSIMLTGDNPNSAANIGAAVGVDFKAGLLPEDKVDYVNQLAQGSYVAMVGDGINDAPAMKTATIGIAMGSGTDVALETADAAITNDRLTGLVKMIALSRATMANIQQNVTIALGLKGIFLVTSLLGITGLWMAVLADSGATVLVTLNALRLLRK